MAHEERAKVTGPFSGSSSGHTAVLHMPTRRGKVVVVYSPKGGTGCTTIATNLAITLQSPETKSVLVDGSMQYGDVAVFLNEQGKNTVMDLTPRVDELDTEFVQEVMVQHPATGLHLLACPPRPEFAADISGEQFSKLLELLRDVYAYVIVDTASYLTETVMAALDAADMIVLVTTQEIAAIKSANLFMNLTDASGIARSKILFVMNRYDKRIAITPEKVGESLRLEIKTVIPFEDRIVTTSINRGVPFVLDNKTSPVSKAIFSLADEVRSRAEVLDAPETESALRK
jgi:pilus assembly protein CpaE